MEYLTNTELADMQLIFGLVEGNVRAAEIFVGKRTTQRYTRRSNVSNLNNNLWEYGSLYGERHSRSEPRYPTHFVPCLDKNVLDTIRKHPSNMLGVRVTRGTFSISLLPRKDSYSHKL
ncbi:hypothetical protein TNCV_2450251 [Trichonephila clavipes]|nr:hypothetical protein TNCV_2450251 [Trichonephila clavipes]